MTLIKLALGVIGALYLIAVAGMFILQRQLQYFPTKLAPTPAAMGLGDDVQIIRLPTPDDENLVIWYAPASANQPTILFFHGNAGEVADRAPRFAAYRAAGFGAAFLSYRGYGGSTGRTTEAGLITDARTAYDWLLTQGVSAPRIALIGESLGTGVAVQLAADRPVGALVLGAPYTAVVDIAADLYPWLPVRLLMKDPFRSIDHIAAVTAPILILHGTDDAVIPYAAGRALYDAATAPTIFTTLDGAGHDALFDPATWAQEIAFVNSVFAP